MDHDYSPIDWKKAFPNQVMLNNTPIYYTNAEKGPILFCLHGAGHSAHSFCGFASLDHKHKVVSFDFRGHGFNTESAADLSTETLVNDTIEVMKKVDEMFPKETMIVIGHSIGGAIAVKTLCKIFSNKNDYEKLYDKIVGLIIIDVVEGSAMDALPVMMQIIANRKESFDSIEEAIKYMSQTQIRNIQSLRMSLPPCLKKDPQTNKYVWKTNLKETEKFWNEWYKNLSYNFLSIRIPKALLLTDCSTLDTPLTIAHMQGKFKLTVIKGTGHFVHEDNPRGVEELVLDFLGAFRLVGKKEEINPMMKQMTKYVEFKG